MSYLGSIRLVVSGSASSETEAPGATSRAAPGDTYPVVLVPLLVEPMFGQWWVVVDGVVVDELDDGVVVDELDGVVVELAATVLAVADVDDGDVDAPASAMLSPRLAPNDAVVTASTAMGLLILMCNGFAFSLVFRPDSARVASRSDRCSQLKGVP